MTLNDISSTLADVVDKASQSVFSVHARRSYPLSGTAWTESLIVTTNRAVETTDIKLSDAHGDTLSASLLGRDPRRDLAILKVEDEVKPLSSLALQDLKIGQIALRLGRSGKHLRATLGIISGVTDKGMGRMRAGKQPFVLSDAASFPGFSGGPLLSSGAKVMGLGTASFSRDDSAAITTESIDKVASSLLEHGRIRRGYVGISGQPIKLPKDLASELEQRAGLLLMSVEPDSPAAKAGLVLGDTLLSLNSEKLYHASHLLDLLDDSLIDKTAELSVLRSGEVKTFEITIGEKKE